MEPVTSLVPKVLRRFGFQNVMLVDEQIKFDGNFPTVLYPNPEEQEALTLALERPGKRGPIWYGHRSRCRPGRPSPSVITWAN